MPRKRKPSYLLHKPTGQARVRIDGVDHYLGEYGSPESRERYENLITEWILRRGDLTHYTLTIDDLALLFLSFAEEYYRDKHGNPTTEVTAIRYSLRPVVQRFGTIPVRDFGPRKLKQIREDMIQSGHVRTEINRRISRIKRMFTWGVSEEYVPPSVATALASVQGLRRGRSKAIEPDPVSPVDEDTVKATLPHMPPVVADMVRLQLLTGARPQEICSMRPCDVTQSDQGAWCYIPASHKTEHLGRQRRLYLGPQAQEILRPYLNRLPEAHCFSPADSERQRSALRRTGRKSPLTPSQRQRQPRVDRSRPPADRYTKDSYRRAVTRACELAFEMPAELKRIPRSLPQAERDRLKLAASRWRKQHCWTPNRLRHTRATMIRRQFGIEAAQVVLGHSDPCTTEIYAERDFRKAAKVMEEIG